MFFPECFCTSGTAECSDFEKRTQLVAERESPAKATLAATVDTVDIFSLNDLKSAGPQQDQNALFFRVDPLRIYSAGFLSCENNIHVANCVLRVLVWGQAFSMVLTQNEPLFFCGILGGGGGVVRTCVRAEERELVV